MRFDFRIAVALGSITLMLASVPLLPKNSAGPAQPLPQQPAQAVAVAEIPPPARASRAVEVAEAKLEAKAEGAPARRVETKPATPDVLPPQPPVTALKLVSVPLPIVRPHGIEADKAADRAPAQVMSMAKANVPLPKARPQHLAALAPVQVKQPPAGSDKPSSAAVVVQAPLPKARPQTIDSKPTQVAEVSAQSPRAGVVMRSPLPPTRPQAITRARQQPAKILTVQPTVAADAAMPKPAVQDTAVAEEAPAVKPSADSAVVSADAKLANASVDFATTHPEVASLPVAGAIAVPGVAEFKPPMPKVRPSNIDRLILVAEMRKYMGTNPTKRRALWCATFMNMVLNKLCDKGTQSDAARSFVDYGRKIPGPKVGAIAVLTRGPNGGHVGVVSGVDKHGNPIIVSGNHGHRVGVGTYPRSRVIAYVLPTPREFKRAAARFSEQTQRSSHTAKQRSSAVATTQLAARSAVREENGELPLIELLAALAAEHSEVRPGSASLRTRANHGRPITAMLAEFLGRKN
jgi:uncharacterized protein (TIGR02594 family)